MKARETLQKVHQLEEDGMPRTQAEIIIASIDAAVAPLATRKEMQAGFDALSEKIDSRFEALCEKIDAQSKVLSEKIDFSIATESEKTHGRIESAKVWMLLIALGISGGFVAMLGSILFYFLERAG